LEKFFRIVFREQYVFALGFDTTQGDGNTTNDIDVTADGVISL
jgi:hypothetical protein